ncbi:MAG: vitamin K epoxide reductase family protein [Candidatus Doudnabacteria bacterium]|nr:vitamin K epoxide reductase family protein [Candidatus Doudnabacteria bacterium]
MLHKKHKHDIIVILSVFGLGVSLYLAVSHYLGIAVPCDITKGCEAVLNSKYSSMLGFPLSVWGVAYFASVIVTALLANHYAIWRKLLTVLLGIGSIMSVVFLSLQFFVIKKVCQYCLTCDLLTIVLFLLDLNIEHHKDNSIAV